MDAADPALDPPRPRRGLLARVRLDPDRRNLRTWLLVAGCLVARPTPVSLAAGWAVLAAGAALHVWARGCLRINREVTTSGPYAHTRNPFYVAVALMDAGLLVAAANPWLAAAYAPLWAWLHHRQIRKEEGVLATIFGDRFRDYVARVPRFVPRLRPAAGLPASEGFSWRNPSIAEGKEFPRLLRAAAAPVLIAVAADLRRRGWGVLGDPRSLALPALAFVAAAALLDGWTIVRLRRGRPFLPAGAFSDAVCRAVPAAAVVLCLVLEALPTDRPDFLVPAGLAVAGAAAVALAVVPVRAASEPAVAGGAEAVLCLAAGMLAGRPALGAVGLAVAGVLAVDRVGVPSPGGGRSARLRRAQAWVVAVAAAAPALPVT